MLFRRLAKVASTISEFLHRLPCTSYNGHTLKLKLRDRASTDANVSYYDRLWAGLTPGGSNLKSTTSGRKQQQNPSTTSGTEPQAASAPKYTLPYKNRPNWLSDKSPLDSPSFSKRSSESYDAPASGGEKASSHFKMMTASASTKSQESPSKPTRTLLSTGVNTSESSKEANETFDSPASASPSQSSSSPPTSGEGVSWADLLAKIQKTRGGSYPSLPTNYQYHDPSRVQKSAYQSTDNSAWTSRREGEESTTRYQHQQQTRRQAAPSTSSPIAHVDTALHEKIFDSQAESRRYSLTLQEEIRYLSSPAQALKWMQDRLFSKTNEESLMYKLDSNNNQTSSSNNEELQYLYGDLLVDVTHYLRTSSTSLPSGATSSSTTRQMAFLPLILAKEHSTKSYLYGCTPKLYALNIRMKWEDHGDIQGVLELLQEMERGAVHLNMAIQDYVKNISLAVMADRLRAQREVEAERQEKEEEEEAAKANSAALSQSQSDQEEVKVENEPRQDEHTSIASAQAEKASTHQPFPFASKYIIEKHIESKLFFSNAQRRALREIERIVVEDRKKYFEYRDREDNLNDNILSRSNSPSSVSSRFASPQHEGVDMAGSEGAKEEGQEEEVSEVNALIESYGRAVPLLSSSSSTIPSPAQYAQEQYQQQQQRSSSRARSFEDADRHTNSSSTAWSSEDANILPEFNAMNNESFDILSQAVSEASEVKPKKIRKQGKSSWSKKGKKTLAAS